MKKRIISFLLIVSMLCSAIPVFADNETSVLDFDNVIDNANVVLDFDDIPTVTSGTVDGISLNRNVSLFTGVAETIQDTTTEDAVIIPRFEMPQIGNIEIPANKKELPIVGWISSNETDEEDSILLEQEKKLKSEEIMATENEVRSILTMSAGTSSSFDSTYRISNINNRDAFALQNQTGRTNFIGDNIGEEYIDPMTGNLVVTETDLILPGVDGLDLNLSRYYSLSQAELYTKTTELVTTPKQFVLEEGMYVVTEEVRNRETGEISTYYYPYSTRSAAELRVEEIESRDTCYGIYSYDAWWERSNEGDIVNINYYYDSKLSATSYQRMRNDLGAGWSWSFPSVQVIKENCLDETEMPKALYYHDGKGNVMEVKYDNANACWFENYVGKDITFEIFYDYDSSICESTRIDYIVDNSDGTKYYFGPHGEIRTIMDLYGNKITFEYDDKDFYGAENMPVISRIIDTVGRVIDFEYDVDGDYEYINITVTSPLESEKSLTLNYEKKMMDILSSREIKDENGNVVDEEIEVVSTEPFLESFTNSQGEKTTYYPAVVNGARNYTQPILFTFADKSFDSEYVYNTSGYTNNLIYLLGNVVRPHSNTYYCYDLCERNLGHSGISEAYRIEERGDDMLVVDDDGHIIDGYGKNIVEYEYSLDYTGMGRFHSIESIPDNEYVARTKEIRENATYTRKFYKKDGTILEKEEEIKYANPVGNNLTITHSVESYLQKQPQKTKITYNNGTGYTYDSYVLNLISTQQNKTYGKSLTLTEELDYDTVGSSDREKHAMLYTYDEDTGFILTKSWYQTDNSKCTESYTYNSDNRLTSVRLADGTETTYSYEYANGKVSKKTILTENDMGTTVTEEFYTPATAYAFPSTITKTVTDGENTTVETTTYTYDMLFGVVKSSTDDEGNTTYYEFDNLGRPTRIIYPEYSTYTSSGTKNINILPVEDIIYQREWREYDDVSEGLLLGSQRIISTLSYYNVTDLALTYPDIGELSNSLLVYYGGEVNYYLGTGEIIESNIIDTVEDESGFVTTTYYYDTYENTKTAVDAKGNRTITQYDGMGRTVKVTDEFNNQQIMEYNISSDGVGFKAQSYFVPSTDATVKENIIEYKYDRLQRVISKKGYDEYPDSYNEAQYIYDFVGNVTGLIDAKGNLNENGYTQTNTYDKLNRITSSKNAYNEVLKNTYDNSGNIKKQTLTDSSGNESILYQREFNGEGKIISDTDNAGNSNIYCYNDLGQLVETTDKDNKLYSAEYNELGIKDTETYVKPSNTMTARNYCILNPYGADAVFDYKSVYISETDKYESRDIQNTECLYSETGKLLTKINSYGYNTGIEDIDFETYSHYTYDSTGNVTSAVHGTIDDVNQVIWAATTFYEYDKNRVTKVQIDGENEKNTAPENNVQYEYYPDGKLKSITYPAFTDNTVLKSEYVYDGLSRLINLTNYKGTDILSSYSYTYDNNGNILTINETVGTTQNNAAYTYDKLNRLATVSGTKGADSYYEYDLRGNRKANYEEIDFLVETSAEFRYNEEDKLYYAEVGENTTNIDYSSDGYRYVKKINSEMPEYYIYDSNGRLVTVAALVYKNINGELQIIMNPVKQYIWGPDRVLAQIDCLSGNSYYYLYNGHGDVVQITDTAGNVVNSYDYDVWGNFLKKEETIENHFAYFGQTYDEETGLYYLRARYYEPATGRFTGQDTAEDGYNWYVYGNQNPVVYADWTGEFAMTAAVAGFGTVELIKGIAAIAVGVTIGNGIVYFAKGGKQNKRSSEFQNVSDAELEEMYKDPRTSKAQKQKIKTEQKARKTRRSSQKK